MAKKSKRILCALMSIIMVLTIIPMGLVSAGAADTENNGETATLLAGQLDTPVVTLKSTAVVRIAADDTTPVRGNTLVPATPSGLTKMTETYSGSTTHYKGYYAGETPVSPTVVLTSNKSLDGTPSLTCENNTNVSFSDPVKSGNTYTWTVNNSSNVELGALKFVAGYQYTYTDSLTGNKVTKTYQAYATSAVEYGSQPGGIYTQYERSNTWHTNIHIYWTWRILGANVFGSFCNPTDATSTWGHGLYNWLSSAADKFYSIADNAAGAVGYGMVNYTPSKSSDGNKYGNTSVDQNRPVSTIYVQEGYALDLYNLRASFYELSGSGSWEHHIRSLVIKSGEVEWSSSTVEDNGVRNELGMASVADTQVAAKSVTNISMTGTGYEDSLTTLDNGNKMVSYTLIGGVGSYYSSSEQNCNTYSAIDLRIVTYDKEDLLALISETVKEQVPTTPYADGSEIGINPNESYYSEGWADFKTALQNAQYVYNDADTDQNTIDAAVAQLEAAKAGLKVKEADYTAVNTLKNQVKNMNSTIYTDESWLNLQKAVNAAVSGYSVFFQCAVDNFVTNINNAINDLEYRPADYDEVNALVAKYGTLVESQYTETTWSTLKNAVDAVDYTITAERQATVDGYRDTIATAIANLKYSLADYTAVNAQVKRYNEVLPMKDYYRVLLWRAVEAAYNSIVYEKDWRYQSNVNTMATNLQTAIDNLEYDDADYTTVNNYISEANKLIESWYTEKSWSALQTTINSVDFTLNKTQQTTVDNYATAIQNAINALVETVGDYTEVNNAITRFNGLTEAYYTPSSWEVAKNAVDAVEFDRLARYQTEIDAYATNINNAIDALSEYAANYNAVNTLVNTWNSYPNKSNYTEDSVLAVANAISAVDYTLKISKQSVVDNYVTTIQTAIDNLKLKNADYTKVNDANIAARQYINNQNSFAVMYKGHSYYTDSTYTALTNAIDNVVFSLDITHQTEVNTYADNIVLAYSSLKYNTAYYTAVNVALAKIPEDLDSGNYDDDLAAAVIIAQSDVEENLTTDKQAQVDEMAENIENAVAALKYKDADYSRIDELAVTWATYPDKDKYTAASVMNVDKAFDSVIRGYNILKQSVVDAMANAIEDAIENLGIDSADYSKVDIAIAAANKAKSDLYTDDSIKTVDDAISAVVTGLKSADQAKVDGYAVAINEAVAKLTYKSLDLEKYNQITAKIPSDFTNYTDVTATTVKNNVNTISDYLVIPKDIRNQAEFDVLVNSLETAVNALTLKGADYTTVNEAIRRTSTLVPSYYSNYDAVYIAISAVDKDLDITKQEDVNAMAKAINDAIDALELKPADYEIVKTAKDKIPEDLTKYTEDSVAVLNNVLSGVDYNLTIDKQAIVNGYASSIDKAVEGLNFVLANYTELDTLIGSINSLNSDKYKNYDEIYWNYIYNYINTTISSNRNITVDKQTDVDDMTTTLQGYVNMLVLKDADYTRANDMKALAAEKIASGYYTEASIADLNNALSGIEEGLDIEHQSQLNMEVAIVSDAINDLVEKPADFSKIDNLYKTMLNLDSQLYTNYADVFWGKVYTYYNQDVRLKKRNCSTASYQTEIDEMYEVMLGYYNMLNSVDSPLFDCKKGSTTEFYENGATKYVSGLQTGLTNNNFLENYVTYSNVTVEIVKSNSKIFMGTGTKVIVKDEETGNVVEERTIVVNGDINGDGKVNTYDFDLLNRIVSGTDAINGAYSEAADINKDGNVDSFDLTALSLVLAGITDLQSVISNINNLG